MKAILLSGGIDSTAIAYWRRPDIAVTIDYGQAAAEAEIEASRTICSRLDMRHELIVVDCSSLGVGNMSGRRPSPLAHSPEWWPYRNQLLVTLAGMRLVDQGVAEIMIGTVLGDGRHADGRPQFVRTISDLMGMQEGGVQVSAPAFDLTSEDLVTASGIPRSLLGYTYSCHVSRYACGRCRGCAKHRQVMDFAAKCATTLLNVAQQATATK